MTIMNIQNKLHTTQFSHHWMTDSRQSLSSNCATQKTANFTKLLKKTELPEKFELLAKRGFKLMETQKAEIPAPLGHPNS